MHRFFESDKSISSIPISQIVPNPSQPRTNFNISDLETLSASIKENGLINPISVRKLNRSSYELIAGERRLMAYKLLKCETIPAIVKTADKKNSATLALIENIHRKDLNFFEEIKAIRVFIDENNISQSEASKRLGFSQPAIANKLRLLKLPVPILEKLSKNGLTERHARALLPLCETSQIETICQKVIERKLSVKETEQLTYRTLNKKKKKKKPIIIIKDLRVFNSTIRRAVNIMQTAGILATSQKKESEQEITYIITVQKQSTRQDAI